MQRRSTLNHTCSRRAEALHSGALTGPVQAVQISVIGEPEDSMGTETASQDPELLRRLLRAKDRMDAASQEAWPIRRLASVSHVCEAHFARSFKDAFGVPPHRYLLTRRIERAVTLLRDSDLSITEIAFQTGWQSLGTFGRVFRDITDEKPSTIRARARAAARELGSVPACILSAAHRPNLTISVLEKRRRPAGRIKEPQPTEVQNESVDPDGGYIRARSG